MDRPTTEHGRPLGDRVATAPYNFVRLPQQVLPATALLPDGVTPWECHDRYVPDLHTGYVDLDITTLTPLFVGPATLSRTGSGWAEPAAGEVLRSFRLTPDGPPVIPGSSINGLLDTMIRILSYSRPNLFEDWDPTLWMRQPATTKENPATQRRGRRYAQLRNGGSKPTEVSRTSGFLRQEKIDGQTRWYIEPLDTHAIDQVDKDRDTFFVRFPVHAPYKVRHPLITDLVPGTKWHDPDKDIEYNPQQNAGWVRREVVFLTCDLLTKVDKLFHRVNVVVSIANADKEGRAKIDRDRLHLKDAAGGRRARPGWLTDAVPPGNEILEVIRIGIVRRGVLVLTGTTGNFRHNEYIFPHPTDNAPKIRLEIDDELFKAIDSADQITAWQEKAFPEKGRLTCDDPVWYETDPDDPTQVASFGRAGGYRMPYTKKLSDLLPEGLQRMTDPLDVCQGLFGDVIETTAIRRRISAGHAVLVDPPSRLAASELDPIRIGLLAPNRQSYALYLTQPRPNRVDAVRDFDGDANGQVAEPRGFKLYLHRQGDEDPPALPRSGDSLKEWESDIVPLRPGLVFRCRVRFANLSQAEVGLLLRAVLLANEPGAGPDNPVSAHKLGRGRPCGLGGVHLEPTLHLLYPSARYTGDTDGFARVDDLIPYLAAWDEIAVRHAQASREKLLTGTGWQRVARLRELALATSWRGRLSSGSLAQMEVKTFAEDRVLPGLLHLFDME